MSTTTDCAGRVAGVTGSGKGSVLWSIDPGDRQILLRVQRGGVLIGEGELRHQLERKDNHPLAEADELLDVLVELEARGLIDVERCFFLTGEGRARLAELAVLDTSGRAER